MKVLAIDTSTFVMGVSVVDGDQVLGEMITNLKKNHSIRLMPAIQFLMNDVGLKPNELNRIVVAHGPGSYTGVRIGVTTAKMLAWSLQIPLVGVSSLETLAQNGCYFQGVISPIFDARRGQIYTGLYESNNGAIHQIVDDNLCLIDEWVKELNERNDQVLFLGNDVDIHKEVITNVLKDKAQFGAVTEHNIRPSELAKIGMSKDPIKDIHTFSPNYIRLAEAEANWLAQQENQR